MSCLQSDKAMDVVRHAADGEGHSIQHLDASAKPRVKTWTPGRFDEVLSILGGPDEVVMKAGVGGRHGAVFMRPVWGAGI